MKSRHDRVTDLGLFIVLAACFIGPKVAAQPATSVPIILVHPEARVVPVGQSNVTFKVVAEPTPPILRFTYQWQQNIAPGRSNYVDIQSATNYSFTINHPVTTNDVAYYRV